MNWVVFWLACFLALCIIVAFLSIQVMVHYKRDAENDRIELKFRTIGGLVHYQLAFPVADISRNKGNAAITAKIKGGADQENLSGELALGWTYIQNAIEKFREIWRGFGTFRDDVLYQLKIFRVYDLHWKTEFGVGDAAATGTLAGFAWAIKGNVMGIISHFFSLCEKPNLEVKPAFYKTGFSTDVSCIIKFRLGDAIVAGVKVAIYWFREGRSWSTQLKD
ncbi:MAG: hypothetical protein JWN30_815 [Bacilli bacterium]|nr:hypothetical protein [Bacilli bacterium]